jgi:sporadic carbohydrate cluster protein (TIGR04323 family)
VPQHIQNLVVRDYAVRRGLDYRLSATEYTMPGCYMILNQVLATLGSIQGIVAYSLFMLPAERDARLSVYRALRLHHARWYAAVEDIVISDEQDAARVEDIILVQNALDRTTPVSL